MTRADHAHFSGCCFFFFKKKFFLCATVCPSIDVRNSVSNLSVLDGCKVIEGFLHIVLLTSSESSNEFSNHSFPALREITGYLLLYRVYGLLSVGQLFPNLAVIRGQILMYDFSLVVYELMQLQVIISPSATRQPFFVHSTYRLLLNFQEIGLKSLTEIQRGSVLIEKNPNLCYAESIDWDRIGYSGRRNHFIEVRSLFTFSNAIAR